jgi:A/G-specific adenine glycosylase
MELGALICTPKLPRCLQCPVLTHCRAAQAGRPADFPRRRSPSATTARRFAIFLVRHASRILVRRQPDTGWNSGLWEFPSVETRTVPRRPERLLPPSLKRHVVQLRTLGQFHHSITRYRLLLDVYAVETEHRPSSRKTGERWCRPADLRKLALSGAHRKILDMAGL